MSKLSMMLCVPLLFGCVGELAADGATTTQRLYLSGKGPADAVDWQFKVSDGRKAGRWSTIPVPSQWEQHGFGDYDYGSVKLEDKHKEDGHYRRTFEAPTDWAGRRVRVVFDGVMTDTTVHVNGQQAGPTHQGGFYRFHYDITDKVKLGQVNQLDVHVSKDSTNERLERAERNSDYWTFGGIYRPVWLEVLPAQFIDWCAVDAKADGTLSVKVYLEHLDGAERVVGRVTTLSGKPLGEAFSQGIGGESVVTLSTRVRGVEPWSAENPNLYLLKLELRQGGKAVHAITERVGFRTVEHRKGEGLFVNGKRVFIKGVNRHCFRPESGRALDRADSYADAKLIKSMNMNAVRCAHYSPDKHFLEACDELGLYVMDELCTWQKPSIDTPTARRLVYQLVRRDVNHASILWWANGNEGGWNAEVDGDYHKWDAQRRPVLHPWSPFGGYHTGHYPNWRKLQNMLGSPHLVMPTEFLHGLYDGGHGASLASYWRAITSRSNGVGGFLWVLADEGIERTDRGGAIDVWHTNAPDGIVGPHHEKEASYYTIKDVWSPVQIGFDRLPAGFDGTIPLTNGYDMRNLDTCRFAWALQRVRLGKGLVDAGPGGELAGPDVAPHDEGELSLELPGNWETYDALRVTAYDREGREIWTWCWPTKWAKPLPSRGIDPAEVVAATKGGVISVRGGANAYAFDAHTGRLEAVHVNGRAVPFGGGPVYTGIDRGNANAETTKVRHFAKGGRYVVEVEPAVGLERFAWTVNADGSLDLDYAYQLDQAVPYHGVSFSMPESSMKSMRWLGQGPRRVWKNRMRGTRFGLWSNTYKELTPSHEFDYPHFKGYYAGVHWMTLGAGGVDVTIAPKQRGTFVRVGTNDEGERINSTYPPGDVSVLHAIPAIGTKFKAPEQLGPSGQLNPAPGKVAGGVRFYFTANAAPG